ncbi:hypothetical protein PT2222_290025 [Paraburkholderia tropica]
MASTGEMREIRPNWHRISGNLGVFPEETPKVARQKTRKANRMGAGKATKRTHSAFECVRLMFVLG